MAVKDLLIKLGVVGDKKAKKKIKGVDGSLGDLGKSAIKAGAAFFGARALIEGFKQVIDLTGRQQEAEASLNAVLKSTNQIAGLTSKELLSMASGFQEVTKFGDEAVIEAQSLMLTFTKVSKEVFPDAIETVLNMSTAMGTDLQSSVVQLGKALNDPVKGISALSRVGVQLTKEQISSIKSFDALGDTVSAQKIILGELETQFGGLAKAQSETLSFSIEQTKNALGDLAEDLGDVLQPAIQGSAKLIKNFAKNLSSGLEAFKKIDIQKTAQNFLKSSDALMKAVKGIFILYIDLLPDFWKNVFNKLLPIAKSIFNQFLILVKEVATIAFEPLVIAISHIGERIKQGFTIIINGILGGVNSLVEKLNIITSKLGFDDIPTINLLDNVQVDPLLDKLKETKIGQFITPSEEDITTISEFTEASNEIFTEYFDTIKELKKEEKETDLQDHIENEEAKGEATKKNMFKFTKDQKSKMASFKEQFDAGIKLADAQHAHRKMLRDNEMNDEIKAVLQSQMTEEQKESSIANIKEKFKQREIADARKMKTVRKAEAVMNTAVAVSKFLGRPIMMALVAAKGAVEIATIEAQQFAKGGIVQGTGTGDTVPAMLTPGELILNKAQQDNLSGGMGGITINIGGNIIGEESFVRDTLIPEIEKARTLA